MSLFNVAVVPELRAVHEVSLFVHNSIVPESPTAMLEEPLEQIPRSLFPLPERFTVQVTASVEVMITPESPRAVSRELFPKPIA